MDESFKAKINLKDIIQCYAEGVIRRDGPDAVVEFIERGKITTAATRLFAPVIGSPVGIVIGPGQTRGTIRVVYNAREVLGILKELFPS